MDGCKIGSRIDSYEHSCVDLIWYVVAIIREKVDALDWLLAEAGWDTSILYIL